ncbi:MAG: TIGR03960 family B12-binding radical SAM protein [Candidatus Cloacimonetes bacterium]|nr:TIGR03960 family B12-binding radical SAM protein [Candidatus Cloacimonadota bacterium]
MKYRPVQFEHLLSAVLKPSRYINLEINSCHQLPAAHLVNFCLVYPDVYEVGFSHLGLKILYSIINRLEFATADRAYTPWPDFGDLLLNKKLPLFGLESRMACLDFDVVGFTLQTELTYTNILYTLELAQIPPLSRERNNTHPLILAGGPGAVNPLPLAEYCDAFLIGDGEEAIIEIAHALRETKHQGRQERLEALSEIAGIYIPVIHGVPPDRKIKARKFIAVDDKKYWHSPQLVPWTEPTHYRFVSEIMRGCSRGCRFCQAGYFYRPVREKEPHTILENLLQEVRGQGWNEAALSSLSSSDYSCIHWLLQELAAILPEMNTTLSLPSLRVDSLDHEITSLLNTLGQTGLTIAPEAGTQRLRDIINKNLTEQDILSGVQTALANGWKLIKLYFMIGLPLEQEADIAGIIVLIEKIMEVTGRRIRLNVTISPFVPKAHTPFQWCGMNSREELQQKAQRIRNAFLRYKFVKINYHNPESSQLECLLGRGDSRAGLLLHKAYQLGARYDGWLEYSNPEIWQQAMAETSFNLNDHLAPLPISAHLPWDNIDLGISGPFLAAEWQKAQDMAVTPDCRQGDCSGCGVCRPKVKPVMQKPLPISVLTADKEGEPGSGSVFYYRVFFGKSGLIRFVAHLDLIRMTQNFLRAAGLPLAYSKGFNRHPRLNFCPPLAVGVEGEMEYFDIGLQQPLVLEELSARLRSTMASPLTLQKVIALSGKNQLSMDYYPLEEYAIRAEGELDSRLRDGIRKFQQAASWKFARVRKGHEQVTDLKQVVVNIEWQKEELRIVKYRTGASLFDFLAATCDISREEAGYLSLVRKGFLKAHSSR